MDGLDHAQAGIVAAVGEGELPHRRALGQGQAAQGQRACAAHAARGHDRHAKPGEHHAGNRLEPLQFHRHIDGDGLLAQPAVDQPAHHRVAAEPDEWVCAEQRAHIVAQSVLGGQKLHRLAGDIGMVEPRRQRALPRQDRAIERAALDLGDERGGHARHHAHMQVGVARLQEPHRERRKPGERHRHRAERDFAGEPLVAHHRRHEPVIGAQDVARAGDEGAAQRREIGRAAGAVEERDAPFVLEAAHLLADGGMGDEHRVRRRREGLVVVDGHEGAQAAD